MLTACLFTDALQLWEHLIFDTAVKTRLLQYAESALIFADHKVLNQIPAACMRACVAPECSVVPSSAPR